MMCTRRETILSVGTLPQLGFPGEMLMVAPASEGIDLFKIAGRSISGWVPSLKTDTVIRQPFCSQLEERLLLWLEYHPQVVSYARGDIGPAFAKTYRLPTPKVMYNQKSRPGSAYAQGLSMCPTNDEQPWKACPSLNRRHNTFNCFGQIARLGISARGTQRATGTSGRSGCGCGIGSSGKA